MLPMLAGASLIYGPGMLENGIVMNLGQLVADADIVHMLRFAQQGVPVNDESLAVDVIREVGIKGEYLSCAHTFENFRTKQSVPLLMNRDARDKWEADGGLDMYEASRLKAKEILAREKEQIVAPEVEAKINAIIARAEAEWK